MRRLTVFALCALTSLVSREAGAARIAKVTLEGKTLEKTDRLLRFMGLTVGAEVGDAKQLEARIDEALAALAYDKRALEVTETPAGLVVRLAIEPAQVIRHVKVSGNFPVYDDEIRRRLTLRPGSRLPAEPARAELLAKEAQRVRDYLRRDGYLDAEVALKVSRAGRPEWIDLEVHTSHVWRHWFQLRTVDVQGASAFSPNDFVGWFGSSLPYWFGRFRQDHLRDDARDAETAYHDKGYPAARVVPSFDPARDVDEKHDEVRLRVRVTEKARVEIAFVGNRHVSDRQLRDKLTIFSAGSYDRVELAQSARELTRFYQTQGFLEARVTYKSERQGDVERVEFDVDEGPELKVRDVEIVREGGDPLDDKERDALRDQLQTRPFPKLGAIGLGGGGYVTPLQLAQDADKIAAFERQAGCPEAKARGEIARDRSALGRLGVLLADVATGTGDDDHVYVRFTVDKGRCESIGGVRVELTREPGRTPARSEDDVRKVLALPVGQPFVADALVLALRRVSDDYAAHGHPYALVQPPRLDWDPPHEHVLVTVAVDEGPEVRFGEILIRGNFKTAPWVIRRDLPFKQGDLFDVRKLAEAERNLQTHAIWNGVRVIPYGISSRKEREVPILVEIQQERYDDWGALLLSAGYSTDVGLLVSPGYYWGNVFGGGGSAELRFDAAFDFTQTASWNYDSPFYRRLAASLRYVHPHLVWPSLRAEVIGFARKEFTVRLGEIDSLGFGTSLSYVVSPSLRLFGRYDLTFSSLGSIPLERLPGRNDATATVGDNTRTGKLTLGVVYDRRLSFDGAKNPLMPVRGPLFAASVAAASVYLGGTNDFLVFSGQYQHYVPLGHDLTLIVNLRGDWGVPIGTTELPAVDRFFAGGDVATRGYETDKMKTEVFGVAIAPGVTAYRVIPRGGNIRLLGTVELQFQYTRLFGFPLGGALFSDVGSLFDSPSQFDAKTDVRVSFGMSLFRLLTPVGPVSFEYAYPLIQTVVEEEWKSQPWYRHWPGLIHFNWGIPILR